MNHLPATWTVATLRCVALHVGITQAVNDACLVQIVGAHFHFYGVTRSDLNEVLTKLARDVREHLVPISQLNPKHSAREDGYDLAFDFNVFFALCFCHR